MTLLTQQTTISYECVHNIHNNDIICITILLFYCEDINQSIILHIARLDTHDKY